MADAERFGFSHKEVVEALIKKQGLHSGVWGLYVEFGLAATNAGPDAQSLNPAAVVPILKIGLQAMKEESSLSVDAEKVNPKKSSK